MACKVVVPGMMNQLTLFDQTKVITSCEIIPTTTAAHSHPLWQITGIVIFQYELNCYDRFLFFRYIYLLQTFVEDYKPQTTWFSLTEKSSLRLTPWFMRTFWVTLHVVAKTATLPLIFRKLFSRQGFEDFVPRCRGDSVSVCLILEVVVQVVSLRDTMLNGFILISWNWSRSYNDSM